MKNWSLIETSFPAHDLAYQRLVTSQYCGDFCLSLTAYQHARNFKSSVNFYLKVSALFHHIIHVISDCANEQMVRINALWIIAPVKNLKSLWDFSKNKSIHHAMRMLQLVVNFECTIPIIAFTRGCPQPAGVCLFDLLPE